MPNYSTPKFHKFSGGIPPIPFCPPLRHLPTRNSSPSPLPPTSTAAASLGRVSPSQLETISSARSAPFYARFCPCCVTARLPVKFPPPRRRPCPTDPVAAADTHEPPHVHLRYDESAPNPIITTRGFTGHVRTRDSRHF